MEVQSNRQIQPKEGSEIEIKYSSYKRTLPASAKIIVKKQLTISNLIRFIQAALQIQEKKQQLVHRNLLMN